MHAQCCCIKDDGDKKWSAFDTLIYLDQRHEERDHEFVEARVAGAILDLEELDAVECDVDEAAPAEGKVEHEEKREWPTKLFVPEQSEHLPQAHGLAVAIRDHGGLEGVELGGGVVRMAADPTHEP